MANCSYCKWFHVDCWPNGMVDEEDDQPCESFEPYLEERYSPEPYDALNNPEEHGVKLLHGGK